MTKGLRMRVFAGPNGSGKSTIIEAVKEYKVKEIPIDFGVYINADDIAKILGKGRFNFNDYLIQVEKKHFSGTCINSGLISQDFPLKSFTNCFILKDNQLRLKKPINNDVKERMAQIIADFLRKELVSKKRKISFETVFSHPSKLDIMRKAKESGYKVYLYFVSTESPEINKQRVLLRLKKADTMCLLKK